MGAILIQTPQGVSQQDEMLNLRGNGFISIPKTDTDFEDKRGCCVKGQCFLHLGNPRSPLREGGRSQALNKENQPQQDGRQSTSMEWEAVAKSKKDQHGRGGKEDKLVPVGQSSQ